MVGLVGPNGSGKSTLLHLINGTLSSLSGFTNRSKGLTIGVLHQEPQLTPSNTVLSETLLASAELAQVEIELAQIEEKLGNPAVYGDEKKLGRALDQQARLLDRFEALGGPNYQNRVRSTLIGLGFKAGDFDLAIEVLSGGQKKLIGLAKLMITSPDLLLLDEPDNHLDLAGKAFLEKYIRNYRGGVVIISHDRYLLDMVVDEIAEIEDGRLTVYPGSYSEFAFEKQARLLRQQEQYQTQQKELNRLETAAKRLLTWGQVFDNVKFIRRGKSILKRIDKIDKIEKPVLDRQKMKLHMSGWRGSNKVLELVELTKSFPNEDGGQVTILDRLVLEIWHGQRVGLIGPNGAGKSLLFRLLLEQAQADSGEIKVGPSIKTGYYAQEHETLDYERTLLDTVRYAAPLSENAAVAFLMRFVFSYEQIRSQIKTLSGGERSRLQMALLMLTGANFLLLDEPTNNLDIASAEVLENSLEEFEGSALVISHDRYFLDRVVDRIIELDNGTLTEYIGGYSDYLAAKNK